MKSTPDSAAASVPDIAGNLQALQGLQAMGATLGESLQSLSGLSLPMPAVVELQNAYLKQSTELWNQTLQA